MSLDALMKLRKGAFGGSASSLPNSTANSPRNHSPFGMQFVPRASSAAGHRMQEQHDSEAESNESADIVNGFNNNEDDDIGLADAVHGAYEDDDEGDERPESPTLTASDYNSLSSPTNHIQSLPPFSPPTRPRSCKCRASTCRTPRTYPRPSNPPPTSPSPCPPSACPSPRPSQ